MQEIMVAAYYIAVGALLCLFGWWLRRSIHEEMSPNTEADRLRAALAPILQHADADDKAPPIKFSVQACREIKESLE